MPGKVNPTQCESLMMLCIQVIANNYAISIANTQGNFQLNTFMPLIAYNVNQSINLLSDGMKSFANKCVYGIKPNEKRINHNMEHCLMLMKSRCTIGLPIKWRCSTDIVTLHIMMRMAGIAKMST